MADAYKEWKKSGPRQWGKTLFRRRPKLRHVDECATFALVHLADLSAEDLKNLESKVAVKQPSFMHDGCRLDSQARTVIKACRILKAIETMKSAEKKEARWDLAMYGNAGDGLLVVNEKWKAFALAHLEHWKKKQGL